MLLLGEIRTCLVRNSTSLARSPVTELLHLLPGERVTLSERPVAHAVSPANMTGVDCTLPTASGARCRAKGTVSAHAVVNGGRILQGSAHVQVEPGAAGRRAPWSHYLARPGVVETSGKYSHHDVLGGFLAGHKPGKALDLGAVSERVIAAVQMRPQLDYITPLRARRTRLRWAAVVGTSDNNDDGSEFVVVDDVIRTFRLNLPETSPAHVVGLVENLALHDWVLTTLVTIVERSEFDRPSGPAALERLRPAIQHLLHLWMPGAHVSEALLPLWESLDHRAGFTRQWTATVARIRDQLALATVVSPSGP